MNAFVKIKIYLLFTLILLHLAAGAQDSYNASDDQEFNIFLMLLLTIFVCGMFGAAIVGSFIAALMALVVFALIAFGVLSTSIAVGIYNKSLSSGFKTFLFIVFAILYGLVGASLAAILQYTFHAATSFVIAITCGFVGGVLCGIVLTQISIKAIHFAIAKAAMRLKLL